MSELTHFQTPGERATALTAAASEARVIGRYLSPRVAVLVLGGLLLANTLPMVPGLRRFGAVTVVLCVVIWIASVGFAVIQPLVRSVRRSLRRQLLERGVPLCWSCGYDLRGLPPEATTCPECGVENRDAARRFQRLLPEAQVFPELGEFANPSEAADALDDARRSLGALYSHRLSIAALLSIGTACGWMVAWFVVDALTAAQDRWVWLPGLVFGCGLMAALGALGGWYAYVHRRMRARLDELAAAGTDCGSSGPARTAGQ